MLRDSAVASSCLAPDMLLRGDVEVEKMRTRAGLVGADLEQGVVKGQLVPSAEHSQEGVRGEGPVQRAAGSHRLRVGGAPSSPPIARSVLATTAGVLHNLTQRPDIPQYHTPPGTGPSLRDLACNP